MRIGSQLPGGSLLRGLLCGLALAACGADTGADAVNAVECVADRGDERSVSICHPIDDELRCGHKCDLDCIDFLFEHERVASLDKGCGVFIEDFRCWEEVGDYCCREVEVVAATCASAGGDGPTGRRAGSAPGV